jgi:hypothetical protein
MRDPQLIAKAAGMDLELRYVPGGKVHAMAHHFPFDVIAHAQTIAPGN